MNEVDRNAELWRLSYEVIDGSVTLGEAVATIAERFGVDCMVEPQFYAWTALDTAWKEFETAAKARS